MMNYIWSGIFAVSILFGILNGRMTEVANALLQGGNEAIQLVLSLLGTMCLWNGLMKIAEQSGLTDLLAKIMRPAIDLIMPGLKRNGAAIKAVCMNVTANLLGLGNAATPLGLTAMKELQIEENTGKTASNNMVTFVVLNTASIQLIPTTAGMLRAKHGSLHPLDLLPAVWLASIIALIVGLAVSKFVGNRKKYT